MTTTPSTSIPRLSVLSVGDDLRPSSTPVGAQPRATFSDCIAGSRNGWPMRAVYFSSDLLAFATSFVVAKGVFTSLGGAALLDGSTQDLRLSALWVLGLVSVAAVQQTYATIPPRPVRKFRGWVLGAAAVWVALVTGAAVMGVGTFLGYSTLLLATGLAVLLASFLRALCRIAFGRRSWWGTRVIVLGNHELAPRTFVDLAREPQWGLRPAGYVADKLLDRHDGTNGAYLGPLEELDLVATRLNIDWGLLAVQSLHSDVLSQQLSRASGRIKHWIILPPLDQFPSLWLEACEAARRPALAVTNRLRDGWSQSVKRAIDFAVALTVGVLVSPLALVIILLIRLSSPGPIFYGQERIGRYGRRFKAWKFRSMRPNADVVLQRYLVQHPELALEWEAKHKLRRDPRVTWVGRWLRSTSLDELPQVWNVLVGQMSLVGPRPIVEAEIDKYAECYEQYVQVLPGITGLWQVSGRNNTTYEERVALDYYYVQNWSLWLDVYILACTAKVVVLCEGAY